MPDNNPNDHPLSPTDQCPSWAHSQLLKLRAIEIQLGNIPADDDFHRINIDAAMKSLLENEGDAQLNSRFADYLFAKIVRSLHHDGFNFETIAQFVNHRVGFNGGPPYCNAGEVEATIKD